MMNKKFYFVANWKMQLQFNEECNFIKSNLEGLKNLGKDKQSIIICPSFVSISTISKYLEPTNIKIGAQNCSAFQSGAHTSQVSAKSLSNLNCTYCIIGHSECRKELSETNPIIANKFNNLISENINPILCIGENKEEYESGKTLDVLSEQLSLIFKSIDQHSYKNINLLIAYEPIWAIGTGIIPTQNKLEEVFIWLKNQTKSYPEANWSFLYGGSVSSNNVSSLKEIKNLNGFLIGGASLNFQEFEKIVIL